jgi:PAS domain S-box-containing protein
MSAWNFKKAVVQMFSFRTIRGKLNALMAISSALALLISFVVFIGNDYTVMQAAKVKQLTTLAEVISSNSTAALSFHQPGAAHALLASLDNHEGILRASLFDAEGDFFAQFVRPGVEPQGSQRPTPMGHQFTEDGYLDLAVPVIEDEEQLGVLCLHADMHDLKQRVGSRVVVAFGVMLISICITLVVTSRLQHIISAPIVDLAATTRIIADQGDYSLRVESNLKDEIGVLYQRFNQMLDRIQDGEFQLRQSQSQLEQRVQQRTEQLSVANADLQYQKTEAELLALVAKYTDNAVVIADACGCVEWVNEGFTRITGYALEEVQGRFQVDLLQGEETDALTVEFMRRQFAKQKGFDAEIVNYSKSGKKYWTAIEARPIEDEQGTVVRFISIESNISERKAAEENLSKLNLELNDQYVKMAAERRLLTTIVNAIPHAIFWKDIHSTYIGCNDMFASMACLGVTDSIEGLTDQDLPWSGEAAAQHQASDQEVMCHQLDGVHTEEVRKAGDGTDRTFMSSKVPFRDDDDQIVGLVGILADITSQKQAEIERAKLLSEAAELSRVIREAPAEVYIFSREDLKFVEVNHGAMEANGYLEAELAEMTILDLEPSYQVESFRELIQPLVDAKVTKIDYQTDHRRKGGEIYPVQVSLYATKYGGKHVYVAFVHDLTDVKLLEQRLSQSQKLESIGQLSAGIAHEINTPMQFVGDNIEFLSECASNLFSVVDRYRELLEGSSPMSWQERKEEIQRISEECRFERIRAQVPDAIEECREGVQRTVKIVKAMKDFSHPGNKSKTLVNLNHAIESTLAISRNRWKFAAEISFELDENLPKVPVFAAEINQVLLNLVVNAADAVLEKFGEETLGAITIRTRSEQGWVLVEVEDNGCGIPEEIRVKVFDPFFTTKDVGKGTGQGLAITQNIVINMHGGRLDLTSKPGEGSCFRISLPLSGEAVDPSGDIVDSPQGAIAIVQTEGMLPGENSQVIG